MTLRMIGKIKIGGLKSVFTIIISTTVAVSDFKDCNDLLTIYSLDYMNGFEIS